MEPKPDNPVTPPLALAFWMQEYGARNIRTPHGENGEPTVTANGSFWAPKP
jgi:hypothetical protein